MVALIDPLEWFEVWHSRQPGIYMLLLIRDFASGYVEAKPLSESASLRRLRQEVPAGLICLTRPALDLPALVEAWI